MGECKATLSSLLGSPAISSDLPLFQRDAKLGNHVPECVGGAEKGCALHRVPDVILRVVRSGGGAGASLAVRHSSNAHCRRLALHVEDHCGLRAAQGTCFFGLADP